MTERAVDRTLELLLAQEQAARQESEQVAESALSDLYATIVDLQQTSSLVTLLQRVAVAANEAATFEDAVQEALSVVCEHTGWPIGHLYVPDDESACLRPTSVWHLKDPERAANFVKVTEVMLLGLGEGLPGRVLESGQPCWIEDVHLDDNFPRARSLRAIEVAGGFAFPALVGTEVVGVLEFFSFAPMKTDDQLLSVLANVGSQLGRVVERNRAAEALQRNEQWTRKILETANDAFVSIDSTGRITDWNRQAEVCFGWSREEAMARTLTEMIVQPAGTRPGHADSIAHFLSTGLGPVLGRRVELEAVRRNGEQFPIELTPWVVEADHTIRFNAFIHDITERKAFERELEHRSLHDSLTTLPNRALLLDRLDHALERSQRTGIRLALLFLDLDRFKAVNDSLGHEAGDQVLLGVAERIPRVLRAGDTFARLSGDEFVVLCEDVESPQAVAELAQRIIDVLAPPFFVAESEAFVSASIGIALTADVAISAEDLLADADLAMYRAKERGRGVYELFDESLRIRVTERLDTERALRQGVQNEELVALYQPLVNLATARVSGVEALVRWQHPERGLLMPSEFIPMAEDTALVGQVGEWMLRESCRQMKEWREELTTPPQWVGVNISVRELEQAGLVDSIRDILKESGIPADNLLLEITESAVMHDAQSVIRRLWELKDMGLRLAIDDFGTGYSSLDRLRRMPVESIKIDRSFVADMETAPGGRALVAAVIAMSHSLGLTVVAEGVETIAQLNSLRRLGCDEVQGFLLARPQTPDHVAAVLASGPLGPVLASVEQRDVSAANLQDEMRRLIERTVVPDRDLERTRRSLLAELQRLIGSAAPV